MPDDPASRYRRDLPHWRQPRATYFVTWRVSRTRPPLRPDERGVVATALRHFDRRRYDLAAFVVMDDHVHVIVTPRRPYTLAGIVHGWKSYTAQRLGRGGRVWQPEYADRAIRDAAELAQKLRYVRENPFRRWPAIEAYAWAWESEGGD